jgi:hypothetical protein
MPCTERLQPSESETYCAHKSARKWRNGLEPLPLAKSQKKAAQAKNASWTMRQRLPEAVMTQPDLFPVEPHRAFDGKTYDADRDFDRLGGQLGRVFTLMKDGRWRTLEQIQSAAGGSIAAISARLRDLRKPKYGSREVERRYLHNGLFEYRLRGQ